LAEAAVPIIPTVGRKAGKVRFTIYSIYFVLSAGSLLMIIPFMLMLTGSTASYYSDMRELSIVPRFLFDEDTLVSKYIEEKYGDWNQWEGRYKELFDQLYQYIFKPEAKKVRYHSDRRLSEPGILQRIEDWKEFKEQLPWRYKTTCFYGELTQYLETEILVRYRRFLKNEYKSIEALNDAYYESNEGFDLVMPPLIEAPGETEQSPQALKWRDWDRFRRSLPVRFHMVLLGNGMYQNWLNGRYTTIERLNKAWGTNYADKYGIQLPADMPANPVRAADWEAFLRSKAPLDLIELTGGENEYRAYLEESFENVAAFNEKFGTDFAAFEDVPFYTSAPPHSGMKRFWRSFVRYRCPAGALTIETGEILYRRWLREKYGDIDAVSKAHKARYKSFEDIEPPCVAADLLEVRQNKCRLRWYFLFRNYRLVIRYMLTRGRAFFNTFVLVAATLLVQLTVNPFAAYALSRFRLPYTYKILVFLLGTMAFPAAVGMVPNFLLLKQLGMLNTYWALFLPGAANGFFIFILKGFFDGLPPELFEIGTVEGASSFWTFMNVVVPLSRPIFAVVALSAFNAAYGGFMWAFIVCQNERMWTVMVWLQQFTNTAGTALQMAALTLAGIPTLLVFIFCQRIIIRGIIIPQFK
jgi:ABC-type glycerol-3-phosphate transport system permease component